MKLPCVALALLFCASCSDVKHSFGPLDPGFQLKGRSNEDLSIAWWQWAMSDRSQANPIRDITGEHCAVNQEGDVWFLAGGFGSSAIRRVCEVPSGKYIFFPAINMVYWPKAADSGYSCDQAKADAAVTNDSALEVFVEIDGVSVSNTKKYRVRTSECFDILERMPASSGAYKAYPSASDGYWFLLPPLDKGLHSIKFGGRYSAPNSAFGRMVQDIEYKIAVK